MGRHDQVDRTGRGPLRRRRERKRVTETEEYVAMLLRLLYNFADRIAADPAAYAHIPEIKAVAGAVGNIGLWGANKLGDRPWSVNELAKLSGASKQAMHQQVQRGEQLAAALAEMRANGAVVKIGDLRRVRAAAIAAAGLEHRELERGDGSSRP